MLKKIETVINRANPEWKIFYEDRYMMNVRVDEITRDTRFVYIEEFIRGQYRQEKYLKWRIMQVQLYFSRFLVPAENEPSSDAIRRERLRNEIIREIVEPFMDEYEKSRFFEPVDIWNIYYPFGRWDGNEVSVMLEFNCKIPVC